MVSRLGKTLLPLRSHQARAMSGYKKNSSQKSDSMVTTESHLRLISRDNKVLPRASLASSSTCQNCRAMPRFLAIPMRAAPGSKKNNCSSPKVSRSAKERDSFPIVGIGASAGGFESISNLLKNLQPDTGLAFVIIQHLGPASHSALANLLVKTTPMPVLEIRDRISIEPNHVYVLTPNYDVILEDRMLRLVRRPVAERLHMPIDHFFQSLAAQEKERAVGVVLSGSGTDGTLEGFGRSKVRAA
jgi:chemotaxis response regulator CheB